jgi:hypothetical protein
MDRCYEERKQALLHECEVCPSVFQGVWKRLEKFVAPFTSTKRDFGGFMFRMGSNAFFHFRARRRYNE